MNRDQAKAILLALRSDDFGDLEAAAGIVLNLLVESARREAPDQQRWEVQDPELRPDFEEVSREGKLWAARAERAEASLRMANDNFMRASGEVEASRKAYAATAKQLAELLAAAHSVLDNDYDSDSPSLVNLHRVVAKIDNNREDT